MQFAARNWNMPLSGMEEITQRLAGNHKHNSNLHTVIIHSFRDWYGRRPVESNKLPKCPRKKQRGRRNFQFLLFV